MKILKLSGKAKRNQNGFTLIELIVTLAIFSIILAVAGNYLYFGNNLFAQTEVKNTQKYIGDSVFEYVQRRLTYATHVEIMNPDKTKDKDPQYDKLFRLSDSGQIMIGTFEKEEEKKKTYAYTNVFGSAFYDSGYQVDYQVKVLDTTHLELTVNVLDKGNTSPVYSTSEVLKTINLKANTRDSGSILVTGGERNVIYTNPVISYNEEKTATTTYDPLALKDQMLDTYSRIIKGEALKDGEAITGLINNQFASNDFISAYVTQFYYKGQPYLGSWSKDIVYAYWPDFPGFDQNTIDNVDKKVMELTEYKGTADDKKSDNQTLTNYLTNYKGTMKMRAYLISESNTKKVSCFVYVSNSQGQQWATRLIYCDVPGESGWYYLAYREGKRTNGRITDNITIDNKVWRKEDGVSSSKTPVYDEITNKASTQEGTWVKVE